jgi:hypothetical protein
VGRENRQGRASRRPTSAPSSARDALARRGAHALAALAAIASVVVARAANAQCGPGAGDCYRPHDEPGCFGIACCNEVCTLSPDCCDSTWDQFCVDVATKLCADIPCPDQGGCFDVHDGTGCIDESCCNFTCLFDPFCCVGQWDSWCVDQAVQLCNATPCTVNVPPGAVVEAEECKQRLTDGCNMASPGFSGVVCGEVLTGTSSTGSPRDTDWYALSLNADAVVTLTISPEFPAEIMFVKGPCEATRVIGRQSTYNCTPAQLTAVLDAGLWYLVVSTATEPRPVSRGIPCPDDDPMTPPGFFGNHYVVWIDCAPQVTAADLNGDGVVDGADLGLMLGAWGQFGGIADLDNSGVVDGADLGILLGSWT